MSKQPIRVMSVDDHVFLIEGLKARFEIEEDIEFVGGLPTADNLAAEAERNRADVVLLDIEMPGADPFEAVADLRRRCPGIRAIMLSAYVLDSYIEEAYRNGAWGYLSKSDSSDVIVKGIRDVAGGELAFSGRIHQRLQSPPGADAPSPSRADPPRTLFSTLTNREQQILRMIARGMTRTDIAAEVCRSPMTIDNHRKSIMKKLGINDRGELVRYAIAEGLVNV